MSHEPHSLLTITEVAQRLHVSDDTVRRQIREGDLEAVQIGTTPKGRPRLRVPAAAVERKLRQRVAHPTPSLERLREVFSVLTDEQKEALIDEAVLWARETQERQTAGSPELPEPTRDELQRRFAGRLATKKRAG
ncbi:helix-turn-helix domain-containing protein [Deinococcus pimensis]|uniref:helix-turn-helix domain-containing protein n=1 Tax=Deinococcus pimensis TaxID=309888 RepID=UPI00048359EE|nr:helix-turn-helix domain-containing protein [Deinococcus pimensis]